MKYLALLIFLTLHLSIHTQVLKGVVLDSITNEKLPYANLVIKGKKMVLIAMTMAFIILIYPKRQLKIL